MDVLDTEPPTYSNSKTYYNVSVSSDGHVVLTPKFMALGNTIHCVQTTAPSVINRQVHRLRSHCWISIPVPWYRTLKHDPRYNCLCSQISFDLFCSAVMKLFLPEVYIINVYLPCTWQKTVYRVSSSVWMSPICDFD